MYFYLLIFGNFLARKWQVGWLVLGYPDSRHGTNMFPDPSEEMKSQGEFLELCDRFLEESISQIYLEPHLHFKTLLKNSSEPKCHPFIVGATLAVSFIKKSRETKNTTPKWRHVLQLKVLRGQGQKSCRSSQTKGPRFWWTSGHRGFWWLIGVKSGLGFTIIPASCWKTVDGWFRIPGSTHQLR